MLLCRPGWPTFLCLAQEENVHQTLVHLHLIHLLLHLDQLLHLKLLLRLKLLLQSGPVAQPHHFQILPQSKSNLIPFHNNLWWIKLENKQQSTRTMNIWMIRAEGLPFTSESKRLKGLPGTPLDSSCSLASDHATMQQAFPPRIMMQCDCEYH